MKKTLYSLFMLFAIVILAPHVDARKGKAKPKGKKAKVTKEVMASKQTVSGIDQLMGKFKWGMAPKKVIAMLQESIHNDFQPRIKKLSNDPLAQDRLRAEYLTQLTDLKKSFVKFEGKQSTWDVSLVDKEFAHKNSEAMVVVWGKQDRRFFFFYNDQLWKIFLAFNSDLFANKTFEDFAQAMETRFGKAERKFSVGIKGDATMDHLAWPPSPTTRLRAIDNTGFYGNFCLVLSDRKTIARVNAGRKVNSPNKKYRDPLVDAVTADSESSHDSDSDIVDRITGKGTSAPTIDDQHTKTPSPSSPKGSPQPSKKRKINTDNPLDDVDF